MQNPRVTGRVVESLDAARIFQGITKLAGIFISYRRSDSQGEAGRLFDDLVKHFGEDAVFMDVAAIRGTGAVLADELISREARIMSGNYRFSWRSHLCPQDH